ncbi:CgeB family protein [Aliarcobacter butzleri]|uniref:CgeB family protein n=1 Tax=Aliarcobacter butzleri TaxID=28197 RepID=UPI002B243813|nr:glycosyltransferase [Aliarcobacter butzleri]
MTFSVFKRKVKTALNRFYSINYLPKPNFETLMSESIEIVKNGIPKTKVLYLAAKYDYGDKSRGLGYEEYNFYYTLKNMPDIEIIRFDFYTIYLKYGKEYANQMIKEVALLEGVDKILYLDYIDYNMMKDLSDNYPIETILWLFDDDKRYPHTIELTKQFNKVVTTLQDRHKTRLEKGFNSHFAANHYLYKDFGLKKIYDVVFIGQNFGNREMYVNYLKSNGINVLALGRGWSEGRITQTQMIEIFNKAKIVLNFSSSAGHPELKFLKGRVFEIPATGSFLLTEECEELDDYFKVGIELERFSTKEEMLEKVRYYLENEEQIAKNGKKKVLENYTFG